MPVAWPNPTCVGADQREFASLGDFREAAFRSIIATAMKNNTFFIYFILSLAQGGDTMDAARAVTKLTGVNVLRSVPLACLGILGGGGIFLLRKVDSVKKEIVCAEERLSDKISIELGHIREDMKTNRKIAAAAVAAATVDRQIAAADHQALMSKLDGLIANENNRLFWGWKKK